MDPTIPSESFITVNLMAYQKNGPDRFDIVAYEPPDERGSIYVSRVIGLPGEDIKLDHNGILVDGERLSLPAGVVITSSQRENLNPVSEFHLLEGEYLLLGDNTKLARDSRFFGPVPKDDIIGKVVNIEKPSSPEGVR